MSAVVGLACGARSQILDEPGSPAAPTIQGAGGNSGEPAGSTSSGPFAVTSAGSGGSQGSGATGPGTSSGPTTASGVVCQPPGQDAPLASACNAYACELDQTSATGCAACLNQAVLTTCADEVHRATSAHHQCGDANQCAETCSGGDLCACVEACMQQGPPKCGHRWANAFSCIADACQSACAG